MASRCTILDLPLETLSLIFKSIPTEKDRLNLARAHSVLGDAFAFYAGNGFKAIEIKEESVEDGSLVLSLCGSSIAKISAQTLNPSTIPMVVKLASKYCPNLQEFYFPVRTEFWNDIKPLLLTLRNLVKIGLINNFTNIDLMDTMLKLPNLKTLSLMKFKRRDWERVGELVNLTELTLVNEDNDPVDIYHICSRLKNIVILQFNSAFMRKPNNPGDEPLFPMIKLLFIKNSTFYSPLPYWPTLEALIIMDIDRHMNLVNVFKDSFLEYGKTLEHLEFCPGVCRTFNSAEREIMTNLKALKERNCYLYH